MGPWVSVSLSVPWRPGHLPCTAQGYEPSATERGEKCSEHHQALSEHQPLARVSLRLPPTSSPGGSDFPRCPLRLQLTHTLGSRVSGRPQPRWRHQRKWGWICRGGGLHFPPPRPVVGQTPMPAASVDTDPGHQSGWDSDGLYRISVLLIPWVTTWKGHPGWRSGRVGKTVAGVESAAVSALGCR